MRGFGLSVLCLAALSATASAQERPTQDKPAGKPAGKPEGAKAAKQARQERWYRADLGKQSWMSVREVTEQISQSLWRTDTESQLFLKDGGRPKGADRLIYSENQSGQLQSLRIEKPAVSLVGRVRQQGQNVVIVCQLVNRHDQRQKPKTLTLTLPPGLKPLGLRGLRMALRKAGKQPRKMVEYAQLFFDGESLQYSKQRAQLKSQAKGSHLWTVTAEDSPVTRTLRVNDRGQMQSLRYKFGFMDVDLRRCFGPIASQGAALAPWHRLKSPKYAPTGAAVERYAVPEPLKECLVSDEFQHFVGGKLRVFGKPRVSAKARQPGTWALSKAKRQVLQQWLKGALRGRASASSLERARAVCERLHQLHGHSFQNHAESAASRSFLSGRGDCLELAEWLCCSLQELGLKARVEMGVSFSVERGAWAVHCWVSALDLRTKQWLHLDPLYPKRPRSLSIKLSECSEGDRERAFAELLKAVNRARKRGFECVTKGDSDS